MVTFSSLHLPTGLVRVLLEILLFFFPHSFTAIAFGRRVGRRAGGVAGPGADGDGRSSPLFTVCILNLHRSCHRGSGSCCLEASWELIFSSL